MNTLRLALVEDDQVIRSITGSYLGRQPEFSSVLVAASAEELLAQLREGLGPHVILLDIGLPGMSGLEAIRPILQLAPEANIIMQTVLDDADIIYQALCQGAMGYLLKGTPLPELKAAVLEVMQGGTPFSRHVSRKVLAHFKPTPQPADARLSPREQQVLQGLVEGLVTKEIAVRLEVGVETVRSYIKNIYTKLQVNSRAALLSRTLRDHP
jgi:DNA-binding NarL/FixJ family response regulator